MGEGITLFVFYVSHCDCMEKKEQVPNAGIRVKFCGSSIIQGLQLVSYNGLVLLLRDINLKKLK